MLELADKDISIHSSMCLPLYTIIYGTNLTDLGLCTLRAELTWILLGFPGMRGGGGGAH